MTKVLSQSWRMFPLALCLLSGVANAQETPAKAQIAEGQINDCPRTAGVLYSRLHSVGLDEQRVYHVRGASLDRPNLHLAFDDGTLAFTEDICGRVTGAMFEGEGEVLLRPPNRVERESLALFTGMAILEEQFNSGYLRFNDDTVSALQPFLSPAEDRAEFVQRWNEASRGFAETDALRLLLDFSHFLPIPGGMEPTREFPRLLHAHLMGKKLGGFELFSDASIAEPLWAGQVRVTAGLPYFDIWTSFVPNAAPAAKGPELLAGEAAITSFRIRAAVQPPTLLRATTEMNVHIRRGGQRLLPFELSRYLKIDSIEQEGKPVEFLQNQALDGTQLRRKGNDLVALIFPAPLRGGDELNLRFRYEGEVLSEAGQGLLYVGERGTWYPSFGLSPAQFDLEFEFPANWTLVATGKSVPPDPGRENASPGSQVARWISERPIAVAGFNLGKYTRAEAQSGNILVEAYGTSGVERSFPRAPSAAMDPPQAFPRPLAPVPMVVMPTPPSPARNVQAVADRAANAIDSFSQWFGPYPYGSLSLTQMPGEMSQGWPGLVFLSSYAFLSPREQADLHLDPVNALLNGQVLVHETAHQWWGDLVLWKSYRDQWIVEGLANYSALLVLELRDPAQFRQAMERYRSDLASKNKNGEPMRTAGPVTLGQRLVSSHFPEGYEAISYERGTWLFHMLRCMLRDAEAAAHSRNGRTDPEEPFFRALRRLRDRYAGKSVSTKELVQVFEEDLPRSLWYEKRRSLDWFYEGWINGTAMPRLEARDVKIVPREKDVLVSATIIQKDAPNDLVTSVPVYAETRSNSQVLIGVVLADGAETPFHMSAPAGTRKILLDPKQTVLTTLK